MSTTKKTPSAAQLEARAKFTKMVKEKAAAKKKGLINAKNPKLKYKLGDIVKFYVPLFKEKVDIGEIIDILKVDYGNIIAKYRMQTKEGFIYQVSESHIIQKEKAKKKGLKAPATKEKEFLNSNLIFKGISRDTNGNKTVKLSFVNKSAFSIQTLGSLPKTHKLNKSDDLTQTQLNAIEKEVVAYIQNFGTITQKKGLKTYTGLKAPAKGVTTFCSKNIGVVGRRKKDGTIKKGFVAKKGGKVVATKKKVVKKSSKK